MARLKLLSQRKVATLHDGYYADGANLYLRVRGDSRVWFFRYKKAGKQISIGLGATHARDLTQVREIAARMRNAIADGRNPAGELNEYNLVAIEFAGYFKKSKLNLTGLIRQASFTEQREAYLMLKKIFEKL